jgi:hypothetical protein
LVDNILLGGKFEDLTGDLIQSESGQVFGTWKNGTITFSKNLNIDKKAFNEYLVKFFILKLETNFLPFLASIALFATQASFYLPATT